MDKNRLCGQDGHLDQTCHRFTNHVMGDKLMHATLVEQVVSDNSTFITIAARNKYVQTSSAVRQVTTSFSPDFSPTLSTSASVDVPMISMIHNPTVVHETHINESPDGSSTGTRGNVVYYVQAIHIVPFCVSLGTNYNRTLLRKINANWDVGSLTSPVQVSATAHVVSSF
jgi:hypothetical protein